MTTDSVTSECPNCQTPLMGKFCYACGQKVIEDHERTVKYFFGQFLVTAFFLESHFIKNFWYLLSRPGFLAREFIEGKRKRYMAPLSLFFLINLIYFFFTTLTDLNLSLTDQMTQPHHGFITKDMVESRLAEREITFEEYNETYSAQSGALSRSLIILNVPMVAFFLMLFYWRKAYYYLDHLIFALYTFAFILLSTLLIFWILVGLAKIHILPPGYLFSVNGYAILIYYALYLPVSVKKFYQQNIYWTILKSVGLFVAILITHFAYRTILFFVTFYST